jgi:hypothetical protein
MKVSRWKIPVEIVVVLTLFLIFFALFMLTATEDEKEESIHYLSTNEYGVYGASRMMALARKLNFNAQKHTLNLSDEIPQNTGIIFILCPEIPLSSEEKKTLNKWVQDGGTLVYGNDIRHLIEHSIFSEYLEQQDANLMDEHQLFMMAKVISDDETPVVYQPSDTGDGVKVAALKPESDDLVLRNIKQIYSPFFFHDDSLKRTYYDVPQNEPDESEETSVDCEVLATDGNIPSIVRMKSGEGRIIAIANPLIFSNGFLEAGDNILFAYNLMNSIPEGKVILIDEYHHGFSTVEEKSILETGWGRALAMLLFAGIIAIYAKAVRFVPPRAVPPPQRRSQVEYLRSMAQILRKAKALKVVSRIMLRDFGSAKIKSDSVDNFKSEIKNEALKKRPSESRIYARIKKLMELENR